MILTILISTYKRYSLYNRVLSSLKLNHTYKVELVTIDGIAGLARARNLGWQKAKGDYVAYIDDDAIAEPDWVKNILAFIKKHPDVVAFGGPYHSSNESELPTWIPRELTVMEIKTRVARPIRIPDEWLTGTNMIFRRDILKEIGGFDESLGVRPDKRAYGEETDLLIRIHNAGHKIWYDPSIKVLHEFSKAKQSFFFLLRDQFTHGYNSKHTFKHLNKSNPGKTANTLLSRLLSSGISPKTRLYFLLAPIAYLTGMMVGKIKE